LLSFKRLNERIPSFSESDQRICKPTTTAYIFFESDRKYYNHNNNKNKNEIVFMWSESKEWFVCDF